LLISYLQPMNLLTLLNVTANVVLSVSALHLILKVFGHPNSPVYARPGVAFLCKGAATLTFCGAVANICTLSTPNWTEVLLNVGVSCNWAWISAFIQTTHAVEKKGVTKPLTNKVYKKKRSASND
jgi:hypothetical protein